MGQYTQVDPIGLSGGNPTLYGYVFNPFMEVDLLGLNLRNALRLVPNDGWRAHHLIPNEVWNQHSPFFERINFTGQHSASNGVKLPGSQSMGLSRGSAFYHSGSHRGYNRGVMNEVNRIRNNFDNALRNNINPDDAAKRAREELTDLQNKQRNHLSQNNGGVKCRRIG